MSTPCASRHPTPQCARAGVGRAAQGASRSHRRWPDRGAQGADERRACGADDEPRHERRQRLRTWMTSNGRAGAGPPRRSRDRRQAPTPCRREMRTARPSVVAVRQWTGRGPLSDRGPSARSARACPRICVLTPPGTDKSVARRWPRGSSSARAAVTGDEHGRVLDEMPRVRLPPVADRTSVETTRDGWRTRLRARPDRRHRTTRSRRFPPSTSSTDPRARRRSKGGRVARITGSLPCARSRPFMVAGG